MKYKVHFLTLCEPEILATRLEESQIHQSLQILDPYNGATHQNFPKCLVDSSN
jgi:hypothetical protein